MSSKKTKLLLHPTRSKIIRILANNEMTTSEIMSVLPDIPQATLYRNIKLLWENNIITVVKEVTIRGTIEKTYTLKKGAGKLSEVEIENISAKELMDIISSFISIIYSDLDTYINNENSNFDFTELLIEQKSIFLNREELVELKKQLLNVIKQYANKNHKGRQLFHVTQFLIPDVILTNEDKDLG